MIELNVENNFFLDKNTVFFLVGFKGIFSEESQAYKEKNDNFIDIKVSLTFEKYILIM